MNTTVDGSDEDISGDIKDVDQNVDLSGNVKSELWDICHII